MTDDLADRLKRADPRWGPLLRYLNEAMFETDAVTQVIVNVVDARTAPKPATGHYMKLPVADFLDLIAPPAAPAANQGQLDEAWKHLNFATDPPLHDLIGWENTAAVQVELARLMALRPAAPAGVPEDVLALARVVLSSKPRGTPCWCTECTLAAAILQLADPKART